MTHRSPTSRFFRLERRTRRALAAVLLAVVSYQSAVLAQTSCVQSDGGAASAAAANMAGDGMASMHHPAQPGGAPSHRSNCDHDNMISSCASCAVVVASSTTIAPSAEYSMWMAAFVAEEPISFDASPRVPPPRI